ncbi:MAG TPA: amylo-alpha-1,6-glucosidase [Hanamia sp.]|nr:amylo-alpha-1,6-glucosidase [Hanamia sp.]
MRLKTLIVITLLLAFAWPDRLFSQSLTAIKSEILKDSSLNRVKSMAAGLIETGFNAGSGYGEVWIRDFNTFIELSCKVMPRDSIKDRLRVFFQMQGDDGNIVDGYIPKKKAGVGYDYIYSKNAPEFAGHKNTVETDQETSLIQAVYKYVKATNDHNFLNENIDGKSVQSRLSDALDFLMNKRYSPKYGLIYGATTIDWGDVQPETNWGVVLDSSSHLAIDIYDNAMLMIALNNYNELFPGSKKWKEVRGKIQANIRKYLWDEKHQKFIPHIYLNGSPFPASFDENKINYHGGTTVAMEAGLLNKKEIQKVNEQMLRDVKLSGAMSIGLTIYPPYPEGYFKNKGMYPYGYQNGGDWTWFGARTITQLVKYGFLKEAYEEIKPMIDRVIKNNGFYEWYTVDGKPAGSASFRGSAGVLYTAITTLQNIASQP